MRAINEGSRATVRMGHVVDGFLGKVFELDPGLIKVTFLAKEEPDAVLLDMPVLGCGLGLGLKVATKESTFETLPNCFLALEKPSAAPGS